MPTNSVEWNFEELMIQKLAASGNYAGRDLVHVGKRTKVDKESIVFEGVKGEKQLEGVQGYSVSCTLSIETLLTGVSEQAADSLCGQISSDIYSGTPVAYNLPDVTFATVEPEAETTRNSTKKMTIRRIKVTGILKTIA